jgi:hypothetical protein
MAIYRCLLALYPAGFRSEFGNEMMETFTQSVLEQQARGRWVILCLREVYDLPGALLRQYWEQWLTFFEGGTMNIQNEFISPSSRRGALIGALPFLAFGLASMLGKLTLDIVYPGIYFWMGFYVFILIGLLIGWVKCFPRWAYAYLGWALVFAWWWNNASSGGWKILGYTFSRIWLPLGVVALLALLRTRSLGPIKQFFIGIWNDWTRLSFAIFAFPAWMALLYDENHHPYLLFFMLGSTLALSLGAYLYLRGTSLAKRMVSLVGGLLVALTFGWICEGTWDYRAYYGFTTPPDPWYMSILRWTVALIMIAFILFGPAIVSILRKIKSQRADT